MEVAVNKEHIINGLQISANIVPTKTGAVYLRSIWLKAQAGTLSIMTTDANIEFTGKYQAEVKKEGLVGVQGRAFVDLVRQLPSGVINLIVDEQTGNLLLKQGRKIYKLPASNSDWFTDMTPFPEENSVNIAGDVLLDIIDRITFCIDDSDNDATGCLYFNSKGNGRIEVCGLNGYQFALVSITNDDLATLMKDGLLIQKQFLQDIKKWLGPDEIELNITDKRLFLRRLDGTETLSVPRVFQDYPDYNVFLSRFNDNVNNSILKVDRQGMLEALGRIRILNDTVALSMSKNELVLSAKGSENGSGQESLETDFEGNVSKIIFPSAKLVEIFGHFSSEQLNMIFTDKEGPCGIKGAQDNEYIVIIMPIKMLQNMFEEE